MSGKNVPDDLLYTPQHEWVKIENGEALVGISDFAQHSLGDVVYLDIIVAKGNVVEKEDNLGVVESVKAVEDLYAPLTGEIIAINQDLLDQPEKVNKSPYEAWFIRLKMKNLAEKDQLLDADAYLEKISS